MRTSSRFASTLDLRELARVGREDRVEVQFKPDSTEELFFETLALVDVEVGPTALPRASSSVAASSFTPQNTHLRTIFILAEAVGGYDTVHDLINAYSPGNVLSESFQQKALRTALDAKEVAKLEDFQNQVKEALESAHRYLRQNAVQDFTREELRELYRVIRVASERARNLNRIMGMHLLQELERTVEFLHGVREKIRSVRRTVDGIFLVDSEVMFVPTNALVHAVNAIFRGLGNTYLAKNVDGVMLLAARNLLIEVVSFNSYYGKQQVYRLYQRGGVGVSNEAVSALIRYEIGRLFAVCQKNNKLMLKRVMRDASREFELSVDAIQEEAQYHAVSAVRDLLPMSDNPATRRRNFWRRLLAKVGYG